jgi:hypothetical protein
MLGDLIGESTGRITGVKILEAAGEQSKFEVSFQGQGKLDGVAFDAICTYWQEFWPDGVVYGEGDVLLTTPEGERLWWKGFGVGKLTGEGFSASFAPCGCIQTSAQRFARLNGVATIGEYDTDAEGNYHWRIWEWKPAKG